MNKAVIDLPKCCNINRILVIKWSAMGDVMLATSVFEDIRQAFPKADIHLNTLPLWVDLFKQDPRFDKIISIDIRSKGSKLKNYWQWLREVRTNCYDLIIDLQANDRSSLLLRILKYTGRFPKYCIGNVKRSPYTVYPPKDFTQTTEMTLSQSAIQAGGIPINSKRPVLHIPKDNLNAVNLLIAKHKLKAGEFALFMPGCHAAGHLKRWGTDHYSELAKLLLNTSLKNIVLVGAIDEMDDCKKISRSVGEGIVNLCGQTKILDIVHWAENARYIVANDNGTAHVASATETPMVVICGPTDPLRVKPAGENVLAVQANIECRNCYSKTCSHHSCMQGISAQTVFELLHKKLPQEHGSLLIFPVHMQKTLTL
ncbi:hypothetical protein MNBD_GAMMA12-1723 [hydrothermal vent metagenome]|uniref:ADP-heptose--lipooligosaccharide heptosyltransferase II n=1 Tax=hydrothermal vent metagenome TaxID=652676 RepID=A0A3B0Y7F4_9ZZZZ